MYNRVDSMTQNHFTHICLNRSVIVYNINTRVPYVIKQNVKKMVNNSLTLKAYCSILSVCRQHII